MTAQKRDYEREHRIDPMWALDEDARRLAIIRRAAAGARKALKADAQRIDRIRLRNNLAGAGGEVH
ncbi:hypothetical protein [Devosia sp. 1635]|uniref:hypothetical protein n=1 Tax=Devosia sp. 1635 TaxID=2726066 RepID=UPI00156779DE|nr:hypothetical protein [Devosia sp. 1635]